MTFLISVSTMLLGNPLLISFCYIFLIYGRFLEVESNLALEISIFMMDLL